MKIVECTGTKLRNNLCTGIKWKLFNTEIVLKFRMSVTYKWSMAYFNLNFFLYLFSYLVLMLSFCCFLHQADVCHAYQLLRKGGLKEENIIVFMYDDIASNVENPRPGVIINKPDGGDVYEGVPKVKSILVSCN